MITDLKYALRMLVRTPAFTIVAVLALALGIGANTAIFSVIDTVLLRPLPYEKPERLVQVFGTGPQLDKVPSSPANFLDWKERNQVFEQIAAYNGTTFTWLSGEMPERLRACRVSADLFHLLGVQPSVGRSFTREEDEIGRNEVAVLSHDFWQTRFGGESAVIGRPLVLNDKSYTVIGIMPPGFTFPDPRIQLWTPIAFSTAERATRDTNYLSVIARLKEGIALSQASAQMNALAKQIAKQHPELNAGEALKLVTLNEETVGNVRPVLLVLLGAVAFVLLICCANVANLLLARASERQKEIAIRSALGASRTRVIRLLLSESLLLALMGGAAGCLLAIWGIDLLTALEPENLPRLNEIGIDLRVLAFTGVVSALTGIAFGFVPALQITNPDVNEMLKEGGRGGTGGPKRNRIRNLLVVTEVALSLVLLIGAGLMIKSFVRFLAVDPGFRTENVLTVSLSLPTSRYADGQQQALFFQRLLERIRELPGIQAAGAVTDIPLFGGSSTGFDVEGRPAAPVGDRPFTEFRSASPDYFNAMSIPLLKGRSFGSQDTADAPGVAIINETLAKQYFGNENPIGKRIGLSRPIDWREIVGVVRDVRNYGLDVEVKPECYIPHLQNKPEYLSGSASWMMLVMRTASDPLGHVAAIKGQVQLLDKDQPVASVRPLQYYLAKSIAQRRFNMLLLGVFASVALVLAAVGIYGVIAYTVTQRTHEMGIRIALGARGADILKLVFKHALLTTLTGIILGLAGAFALTRLMRSLLYQVAPTDPFVFLGLTFLLIVVAVAATYMPARRATRVDPIVALRYE
jgi:putative ABC transport system permease protein